MENRDYNKDPIIVKDYGAYFQLGLVMLLNLIVLFIFINEIREGKLQNIDFYEFEFSRKVIVIGFMIWFLYFLYDLPNRFKKNPSFFKFTSDEIYYIEYYYDKEGVKIELSVPIKKINKVSLCIVAELQERYGRWHHLSSWKLYRKSSIGVHIGKATIFIRYLITYIFFILPYKLWRLFKWKEPINLLRKNLFIQFDNRNYFLINIYAQKELDDLFEYFKLHNIEIQKKIYFIPHLQDQGWFVDKEEVWTEEE